MLRAGIPSQRDFPGGRKAAGSPECPVGCLRAAPQSKLLFPRGRRGASISWRNALCRSVAIPCGSCCQEEFLPLTNLSIIVIIIKKKSKKQKNTPFHDSMQTEASPASPQTQECCLLVPRGKEPVAQSWPVTALMALAGAALCQQQFLCQACLKKDKNSPKSGL